MNGNYHNQVGNYKPLAELQTVPPYGSFYASGYPSQNQNLQYGNLNQAQTNVNFSSNVNSENPNNNNNNIEFQKTPLQYNQVISNPQMSRQFYPSLFLPQQQYQGHNQPYYHGNKQIPFLR